MSDRSKYETTHMIQSSRDAVDIVDKVSKHLARNDVSYYLKLMVHNFRIYREYDGSTGPLVL